MMIIIVNNNNSYVFASANNINKEGTRQGPQ